jgi:hypothetical protein|tara:strand:- start:162 stop:461 length:300 start_codon:yes stop_codon:yes gene_type:complete
MSFRKFIGYFTSPFFVPLRKLVVWGDRNFGTCDMRLTLEERPYADSEDKHDSAQTRLTDFEVVHDKHKASLLEVKLSEDQHDKFLDSESKVKNDGDVGC